MQVNLFNIDETRNFVFNNELCLKVITNKGKRNIVAVVGSGTKSFKKLYIIQTSS